MEGQAGVHEYRGRGRHGSAYERVGVGRFVRIKKK